MELANQCIALSERLDFKKGIGNSYNCLGQIYVSKSEYLPAMEFHKKALKIRLEINDKKGIAGSYNNIGLILMGQGHYPRR
jgi:uncharacterized protein HemY